MALLTLTDLRSIKDGKLLYPAGMEELTFSGVSIDSRTIRPGELFFAIRGERFDGHDFLKNAVDKGVRGAVTADEWHIPDEPKWKEIVFLKTRDTTRALQELAAAYRLKFRIPVIGVTGTNGKTTTKEMIAAVLSRKYRVVKTPGNFNNRFGLPLTLFNLTDEAEIAVVELGASYPGEIAALCSIASPTHGLITNIGKGHIAFFKTLDEVASTKLALIDCVQKTGTGFINGDDPLLRPAAEKYSAVVTFGMEKGNTFSAAELEMQPHGGFSFMLNEQPKISLRAPGRQNVYNALAAAAVGSAFEIDNASIKDALESYKGFGQRLEIMEWKGATIINDSYNANPDSMKAALELLLEYPAHGRRFAILGDMLELGSASRREHETIGREAARRGISRVITVGGDAGFISETANITGLTRAIHATGHEQAARLLRRELRAGDIVLVKGSRGIAMEKVLSYLMGKNSGSG